MNRRLAGWIGAGLLTGALILQIAVIALYIYNKVPSQLSLPWGGLDHVVFGLGQLYRLGFAAVGALVVARRPGNAIGWLFLGAALALSLGEIHLQYADFVLKTGGLVIGGLRIILAHADLAEFGRSLAQSIVLFFLVLALLLLFPTGRLPSRRWLPFALFSMLIAVANLVRMAVLMWSGYARRLEIPGFDLLEYGLSILGNSVEIGIVLSILNIGIAGWSLVSRYRAGKTDERHQIKWFALAGSILALLFLGALILMFSGVPMSTPEWNAGSLIALYSGLLLLPAATAIAIFKYHLYDIDLVIRRALTFGSLALFITVGYVGIVVGSSHLLGAGDQNLGLSIIATGLVATAFQPARERAQRLASRLAYGEQAEPYEILAKLARRVGTTLDAEQTLPLMAEASARGVRAKAAQVTLFLPDGQARSVSWPPETEVMPAAALRSTSTKQEVLHLGELVGEIEIRKAPGDDMRASEVRLLSDLAAQAGLAFHNLRLTAELQNRLDEIRRQTEELAASQRRILTAELWTRLRLERELHGKVGRLVVTTGELLREAEHSLGDITVSGRLLNQAADEARTALEEVRDLARGIFPTLLSEEGVVTALRAQLKKSQWPVRLQVQAGMEAERFDEHSEAAAYFCCVRAIEHLSGPDSLPLELDLMITNGRVRFSARSVEPAFRKALEGPQWQEMADRVEALGGSLEISQGTGGTVLSGEVPAHPVIDVAGASR